MDIQKLYVGERLSRAAQELVIGLVRAVLELESVEKGYRDLCQDIQHLGSAENGGMPGRISFGLPETETMMGSAS